MATLGLLISSNSIYSSTTSQQCDATKKFYQNMACCGSGTAQVVCNSASNVSFSDVTSQLGTLTATRANYMGTAASQFVDSNASPCPSTPLQALFQTYLKRMPTSAEVASASTSYGYIKVAEPMINEFMTTNYPSIVDGTALGGKVFAMVGGSSGLGFTASVLLAKYGATVYSCSRTASVFEASKAAAMASYDNYESDLAASAAYYAAHGTMKGHVQKYFPMYGGLMNVSSGVLDKIHFSVCDARSKSSILDFFGRVNTAESGKLDGVFFVAGTYGAVNGLPKGAVVSQVASVGPQSWTARGAQSLEEVMNRAPNRSVPQIEESPFMTITIGEMNTMESIIETYGLTKAKSTRITITGSVSGTSLGNLMVALSTPNSHYWAEYLGARKNTMIRYESWLNAGFDIRTVLPGSTLSPLNGPVYGQYIGNHTALSPFVSRMPTTVTGGYDFVESARIYQNFTTIVWNVFGVIAYPEVTTAAMIPIAAASSKTGLGLKQFFVGKLDTPAQPTTYRSVQPGGVAASAAWKHKIGACAILDASATADVEAVMQAEWNIFGPGPLCLMQGGSGPC